MSELVSNTEMGATASAILIAGAQAIADIRVHSHFKFECWRRAENCDCAGCLAYAIGDASQPCKNQFLAWSDIAPNIVVTVGKNDILTKYFAGSSYTAAWFIGLVDGGSAPTYAAGDTMASHAGWTENVTYSQGTRPAWTAGTASAGSIDNAGSPAVYSINGTATIAGAFSVTNSTKSGTTGTLYSEVNFTGGNRAVLSGDTLNVTQTFTAS